MTLRAIATAVVVATLLATPSACNTPPPVPMPPGDGGAAVSAEVRITAYSIPSGLVVNLLGTLDSHGKARRFMHPNGTTGTKPYDYAHETPFTQPVTLTGNVPILVTATLTGAEVGLTKVYCVLIVDGKVQNADEGKQGATCSFLWDPANE